MLTLPAFVFLLPSSDDSTLMGTAATFTAYDVFLSASLVPGDIQQSSEVGVELGPQEDKHISQCPLKGNDDIGDNPLCVRSTEAPGSLRSHGNVAIPESIV
ncbi:unnamed protein product [Fusarium langsethiae]|nr:unnamed protein product [Fusarium langsethiae]